MLCLEGEDLILGFLAQSVASLGEAVALLDLVNEATDFLVVALVDLVLDGLLLTLGINLLLELLIVSLKSVELNKGLVELVLLQLDLVSVTLDHGLLDLVLLDALVDSVLLAGLQSGELFTSERASLQIEALEGDTELLTSVGIINVLDRLGLLLDQLLLGLLDLSREHHKSPKFKHDRYKTCSGDPLAIYQALPTYFFSCSNFLVKESASRWRRWASDS